MSPTRAIAACNGLHRSAMVSAMDATPIDFTMQEAADRCGVDKSTISRKRKTGKFPNAWKEADGSWRIPLADLLADGLAPVPATQRTDLQPQVVQMQHRAELAEMQLAERDKTIQRLEHEIARLQALFDKFDLLVNRVIESPSRPERSSGEAATRDPVVDLRNDESVEPKRRWWRRG